MASRDVSDDGELELIDDAAGRPAARPVVGGGSLMDDDPLAAADAGFSWGDEDGSSVAGGAVAPAPRPIRSAIFDERDDDNADTDEHRVQPARPQVRVGNLPGRAAPLGRDTLSMPSMADDEEQLPDLEDFDDASASAEPRVRVREPLDVDAWARAAHRAGVSADPDLSCVAPSPGRRPFEGALPPPPARASEPPRFGEQTEAQFARPMTPELEEDYHAQRPSRWGRAGCALLIAAAVALIGTCAFRDRISGVLGCGGKAPSRPAAAGSAIAGGDQQGEPAPPAAPTTAPRQRNLTSCAIEVVPDNGGGIALDCTENTNVIGKPALVGSLQSYIDGTQRKIKGVYRVELATLTPVAGGATQKQVIDCGLNFPRPTDAQLQSGARFNFPADGLPCNIVE